MKGKFVKGEIIKLAIDSFEASLTRLDKENNSGTISNEQMDKNIEWMWKYRHAKEYLEKL